MAGMKAHLDNPSVVLLRVPSAAVVALSEFASIAGVW